MPAVETLRFIAFTDGFKTTIRVTQSRLHGGEFRQYARQLFGFHFVYFHVSPF